MLVFLLYFLICNSPNHSTQEWTNQPNRHSNNDLRHQDSRMRRGRTVYLLSAPLISEGDQDIVGQLEDNDDVVLDQERGKQSEI
jgi:hypothetical protein